MWIHAEQVQQARVAYKQITEVRGQVRLKESLA